MSLSVTPDCVGKFDGVDDGSAEPFRVLFVCTGNICRSPTAATMFRRRTELAGADKQITAGSAGVATETGWRMDSTISGLLDRRGLTGMAEFRSRLLSDEIVNDSDLLLTGTREHRLRIGKSWPAAYPRTFTLRETAWLLTEMPADVRAALPTDPGDRAPAVLSWLQQERGLVATPPEELDIDDPMGRRASAYRKMVEEVAAATDILADLLLAAPEDTAPEA